MSDYVWVTNRCVQHGYEGVPPCPVPDCPHGVPVKDGPLWIGVKARLGESSLGMGERIFLRHRYHPHRNVEADGWVWRELVDKALWRNE